MTKGRNNTEVPKKGRKWGKGRKKPSFLHKKAYMAGRELASINALGERKTQKEPICRGGPLLKRKKTPARKPEQNYLGSKGVQLEKRGNDSGGE